MGCVVEDVDFEEFAECVVEPILVKIRFSSEILGMGRQVAPTSGINHRLEFAPSGIELP